MNFSGVSYDEAMRRARECVPLLKERAQKCEDARVLLPENEKLLHEAGLFRFHQPKRFGGMELPFQAIVDIVAELARARTRPPPPRLEPPHPRLPPLDPRLLRARDAARGVGRESGCAHCVLDCP